MATQERVRTPHGYPVEPIKYLNTSDLIQLLTRLDKEFYTSNVDDVIEVLKILENPNRRDTFWPDPIEHFDYYMRILNEAA